MIPTPSPCDECPQNTPGRCTEICTKWDSWFRPLWRAIRRRNLPPEKWTVRELREVKPNE